MNNLKEECAQKINAAIETIFNSSFKEYLDVVANCYRFSFLNQLLIYSQMPAATILAGKGAWARLGKTIHPAAKPIMVLNPKLICEDPGTYQTDEFDNILCDEKTNIPLYDTEPKFFVDYSVVGVYDISAVKEDYYIELPRNDFEDCIKNLMNVTVSLVPKAELPDSLHHYLYSEAEETLYIANNLTDVGYDKTLLEAYVSYVLEDPDIIECPYYKELKLVINYCVQKHFGIENPNSSFLFIKKLADTDKNAKMNFLHKVQTITEMIIRDFEGVYLNFNETAIINHLFNFDIPSDIAITFEKVNRCITDKYLSESLISLRDKLLCTDDGSLCQLYTDKINANVFTFPPYKLNIM